MTANCSECSDIARMKRLMRMMPSRHDPSRLKYIVRRLQEYIETQADLICTLQAENRLRDAESCRWINAACEALEAIGEGVTIREAVDLNPLIKIDVIKLLCEVVKERCCVEGPMLQYTIKGSQELGPA